MKVSDYIAQAVAGAGVRHVFCVPGGGSMHLIDSFGRQPGVQVVASLHEQGAAVAADGYAQYTGGVGVALVTTGPGGTNTLTALAGAWLDSTPLVVIAGQVKTADMKPPHMRSRGFQEVDVVAMAKPVTKFAATIESARDCRSYVQAAFKLATTGRRGPVFLAVPLDVQASEFGEQDDLLAFEQAAFRTAAKQPRPSLAAEAATILHALSKARRPVLLAGHGVRAAGACDLFRKVAATMFVPTLLTYRAADLLHHGHPLNFGRPGTVALRGANLAIQNSDFLLCVGARLDFGQTGYDVAQFAPGARKFVVDVDPSEHDKLEGATHVKADAKEFLEELDSQLGGCRAPMFGEWRDLCEVWRDRYSGPCEQPQTSLPSTRGLVDELSRQSATDDVLVPSSSGASSEAFLQAFQVKRGHRVVNSPGLGAMGYGVPQAVGVALASGRRVVATDGDGGFPMNAQELEVARRLRLPVKFFVLDNGGYGSIRQTQDTHFGGRHVASDSDSGLTLPSASDLAQAYGIPSTVVSLSSELGEAVRFALAADGPFVCQVVVDPSERTLPRVASRTVGGRIVSGTLHDMLPHLPPDEQKAATPFVGRNPS